MEFGRSVLVLVSPESFEQLKTTPTGEVIGVAINNASGALLADLAMCEVVFTTAKDLALLVPAAARLGAPMLFLVEPAHDAPKVKAVPISLEGLPNPNAALEDPKLGWKEGRGASEKAIRARNERVAQVIHATLIGDRFGEFQRRRSSSKGIL